MATTKWLRLQIISSTPCLKKQKQTQKSSILADDATLLFYLETDMTGVCVCCVVARHGAARNDDMLIGDRSGLVSRTVIYFIILIEIL